MKKLLIFCNKLRFVFWLWKVIKVEKAYYGRVKGSYIATIKSADDFDLVTYNVSSKLASVEISPVDLSMQRGFKELTERAEKGEFGFEEPLSFRC